MDRTSQGSRVVSIATFARLRSSAPPRCASIRWSQWIVVGTATLGRPDEMNCSMAICKDDDTRATRLQTQRATALSLPNRHGRDGRATFAPAYCIPRRRVRFHLVLLYSALFHSFYCFFSATFSLFTMDMRPPLFHLSVTSPLANRKELFSLRLVVPYLSSVIAIALTLHITTQ